MTTLSLLFCLPQLLLLLCRRDFHSLCWFVRWHCLTAWVLSVAWVTTWRFSLSVATDSRCHCCLVFAKALRKPSWWSEPDSCNGPFCSAHKVELVDCGRAQLSKPDGSQPPAGWPSVDALQSILVYPHKINEVTRKSKTAGWIWSCRCEIPASRKSPGVFKTEKLRWLPISNHCQLTGAVVVVACFRARVTTGQSWWLQVSALESQLASRGGHKFPRSSHNWPVVVATSFRARVTTGQSWWPQVFVLESQLASRGGHKFPRSSHN